MSAPDVPESGRLSEEEQEALLDDLGMICDAYGLPHDVLALAQHLGRNAALDHEVNMHTIAALTAELDGLRAMVERVRALHVNNAGPNDWCVGCFASQDEQWPCRTLVALGEES